jgi:hypothetical protein
MKLKKKNGKINLPLKVLEQVKSGSQTGVKGINLLDNKTVDVFLTTQGKSAENHNRPNIESLFSGIETEGATYKLKPGCVISMNGAFRRKEGGYYAQWPMVVKYSEADTVLLCENGTLIINENQRRANADFYIFNPEQSMTFTTAGSSLKAAMARNAGQTSRPAYLMRLIEGKNVLDYEIHQAVYDKTQKKPMTSEQIADSAARTARELLDRYPGKKLDIMPATRLFVPARTLEKRQAYFNKQQPYFQNDLENGDREYLCRKVLVKCGGGQGQFCNLINVIEPYAQGSDPVLIGGYSYQSQKEQENDRPRAA